MNVPVSQLDYIPRRPAWSKWNWLAEGLRLLLALGLALLATPLHSVQAAAGWNGTGSMDMARPYHTATRLPDGMLLVQVHEGDQNPVNLGQASAALNASGSLMEVQVTAQDRPSKTYTVCPTHATEANLFCPTLPVFRSPR